MSKTTENLGLFKYDPSTDGAQTFNIEKSLNENWDKIDAAVLLTLAAAAPYSAKTYALGAYCTKGGRMYRCTTAITAAETWTAGHWTETTVTAELIAHATSKSNPHGVTAAQTGAYTKGETDTLLAKKANLDDFSSHASQHASGGSDPVQISMSQVADLIGTLNGKISYDSNEEPVDFNSLPLNSVKSVSFNSGVSQADYHTPLGNTTSVSWYIVETYGIINRAVQIAWLPYKHHKKSFIRYKHDTTWSDWIEIATATDLVDRPKIAIGSYTGTGTHGANSPNTINLGVVPKLVLIMSTTETKFTTGAEGGYANYGIFDPNITQMGALRGSIYVSFSGTTLSWYTDVNSNYFPETQQLNKSGVVYKWYALY